MNADRLYSVGAFSAALDELCAEYLRHFDPGAPVAVASIRLDVAGPNLTLTFQRAGSNPPSLHIALSAIDTDAPLVEPTDARLSPEDIEHKSRWRS